jgi:hypothetical protein
VAIVFRGKLMVEDEMSELLDRVSPDREIRVDLESVPEGLVDRVRELPFVLGAEATGDSLVVKVAKDGDFRKALSERLYAQGLVPLQIAEKTPSLEEAFITITQENIAALAKGGAK